jgi:drug/metabolite transporter (DMT)-like permease
VLTSAIGFERLKDRFGSSTPLVVLFLLGGVWGASFLFIKVLVGEVSPLEVVAGRMFLGAVAVLAFVRLRGAPLRFEAPLLLPVAALTVFSHVLPFGLVAWGEEHIDSGIASVLNSTMPIFTAAIAAALLPEEVFTPGRLAGLLLGFLGILVLSGEDILRITDAGVLGQLAVVAAAACYGLGSVYARRLLRRIDPVSLSVLQLTAGVLICTPFVLALDGIPAFGSMSLEAWGSLLTLGLAGTGIAYLGYLWLIEHTGSVRASIVTYIVPVVALLLGWLVLDESIGLNTLGGAALIIVGVATVMRGRGPAAAQREEAPGRAAKPQPAGTSGLGGAS